nr:hypothetical protein [Bacillus pumilus]
MKKGRELLARYGMTLVSKPGFGLKIEGDELQKRTCYADLLLEEEPALSHITEREQLHFPDISLETIRSIVLTNLHQESLLIKDIALKNLVIHLAIAIQQTRKKPANIGEYHSYTTITRLDENCPKDHTAGE